MQGSINTKIPIFILFFGLVINAQSQIVINEVSAANENTILDEFGNPSDWVELYNAGTETVNLEGWFLSDKEANPQRWRFPNVAIEAGTYLLVFASGQDVQAVNLHTNFRLTRQGEEVLLSSANQLEDRIQLPPMLPDISYGRLPNGSENWFFMEPSLLNVNEQTAVVQQAPTPTFSEMSSFQTAAFALSIQCDHPDCLIYYSLDGSPPNEQSIRYINPFLIQANTPVRAIAYVPEQMPSPIVTKTYFINVNHELPIVAISADAALMFDETNGIFMDGPDANENWPYLGANFWKDTEIPAQFEYFDVAGNIEVSYHLGMRTHGGRGARTKPQKPVRFIAEPKFGANKMRYPFFEHKDIDSFERLVLRNSSGDFNAAHYRSGFMSNYLLQNELNLDLLAYQPTVTYINGAYWGVMNIREKSDEFFLESNYGLAPYEVDMLEEEDLVVTGDFDYFDQHFDFIKNHDLSQEANFLQAAEYFDVWNVAEYFITQTAINNTDWPQGNLKYWRARRPDAKWRYLMFDMDTSTDRYGWTRASRDGFFRVMDQFGGDNPHVIILEKLLENESFRHYFINRYADLLNTTFRAEIFSEAVAMGAEKIRPEMAQHFERWSGCVVCYAGCLECFEYADWDTLNVPKFINFAKEREPFARQAIQDFFELPNQVELTLNTFPENAGTITINTITPEALPWDGWYFNGVPVTLSVESKPGFNFSHWESSQTILSPDRQLEISYNFEQSDTIFAFFEFNETELPLSVAPNPASEAVTLSIALSEIQTIDIRLFSIDGKLVRTFAQQIRNIGLHQIPLFVGGIQTGVYLLEVNKGGQRETLRLVLQ